MIKCFCRQPIKIQNGRAFMDSQAPLQSCDQGQYPPGSVFNRHRSSGFMTNRLDQRRTIIAMAFMSWAPPSSIVCTPWLANLAQVLCIPAIFIFSAGQRVGAEAVYRYSRLLGFGRPTD